eukprot:TRINITY_DN4014_c0_g1_i5.p1 TRINITY_DN4014_c0_g1~~TRINITY_DN4014_c0_g1_i5.p1  ORF type:complete len:1009 (-),score=215.42 TRINITY_DN4014_c0_g1_i5:774-3800(-)
MQGTEGGGPAGRQPPYTPSSGVDRSSSTQQLQKKRSSNRLAKGLFSAFTPRLSSKHVRAGGGGPPRRPQDSLSINVPIVSGDLSSSSSGGGGALSSSEANGALASPRTEVTLREAVRTGNKKLVESVARGNEKLMVQCDEYGRTLLHLVAQSGRHEMVSFLAFFSAEFHPSLDAIDENGWTPLHCAAATGNLQVCEQLLLLGSDCQLLTISSGNSVLHLLAERKMPGCDHGEVVTGSTSPRLRASNPDAILGAQRGCGGATPSADLHNDTSRLVHRWGLRNSRNLSSEFNTDVPSGRAFEDERDNPVLMRRVLDLLFERDVDIDIKSKSGDTPLLRSVASGRSMLASCLLAQGADPNTQNIDGECPLHFAVRQNDKHLVSELLRAGARLRMRREKIAGMSVFDLAHSLERTTIVDILESPSTVHKVPPVTVDPVDGRYGVGDPMHWFNGCVELTSQRDKATTGRARSSDSLSSSTDASFKAGSKAPPLPPPQPVVLYHRPDNVHVCTDESGTARLMIRTVYSHHVSSTLASGTSTSSSNPLSAQSSSTALFGTIGRSGFSPEPSFGPVATSTTSKSYLSRQRERMSDEERRLLRLECSFLRKCSHSNVLQVIDLVNDSVIPGVLTRGTGGRGGSNESFVGDLTAELMPAVEQQLRGGRGSSDPKGNMLSEKRRDGSSERRREDSYAVSAGVASSPGTMSPMDAPMFKQFHLVTEFFPGQRLHDYVRIHGPLKESRAKDVILQVAAAVEHCHQMALLNRELLLEWEPYLNPENVFIRPATRTSSSSSDVRPRRNTSDRLGTSTVPRNHTSGRGGCDDDGDEIKVGPFSLSRKVNPASMSTFYFAHAAPETIQTRFLGFAFGKTIDAWTVGVMLYIILTGRFPFSGGRAYARMENILNGKWDVPDPLLGLSEKCLDVIDCLLDPDPFTRIPVSSIEAHPWCSSGGGGGSGSGSNSGGTTGGRRGTDPSTLKNGKRTKKGKKSSISTKSSTLASGGMKAKRKRAASSTLRS